jgi:hypothetical protein
MANEQFVPVDVFITTTKILLTQIHDMNIAVRVLRLALMQTQTIPVATEYLMLVEERVRNSPQLLSAREAIQSLSTTEGITELLQKLEGRP